MTREWMENLPETECMWHRFAGLASYWLLLRGGIVQSIPCTVTIFWFIVRPHPNSNHSWLELQNSVVATETPSSEAGAWREISMDFADEVPLSYLQGSLTCRKILRHGSDGFTPSPISCYEFLSPLKSIVLGRVWTRKPWVQWQAR
jgi:hypothetical protein